MIILVIKTDKPEAELGLYNVKGQIFHKLADTRWRAQGTLADTVNTKI